MNDPLSHKENEQEFLSLKEQIINRLKKLGGELPTVNPLVNLKTNNVFAEPGC